jgi:hypothetical protein
MGETKKKKIVSRLHFYSTLQRAPHPSNVFDESSKELHPPNRVCTNENGRDMHMSVYCRPMYHLGEWLITLGTQAGVYVNSTLVTAQRVSRMTRFQFLSIANSKNNTARVDGTLRNLPKCLFLPSAVFGYIDSILNEMLADRLSPHELRSRQRCRGGATYSVRYHLLGERSSRTGLWETTFLFERRNTEWILFKFLSVIPCSWKGLMGF